VEVSHILSFIILSLMFLLNGENLL